MSLTSYRAAPPRDKPCAPSEEKAGKTCKWPGLATAPILRPERLPEKATRKPLGTRARGVCTNAGPLWKGCRGRFFRFCDREMGRNRSKSLRSCQNGGKGGACSKIGAGLVEGPLTRIASAMRSDLSLRLRQGFGGTSAKRGERKPKGKCHGPVPEKPCFVRARGGLPGPARGVADGAVAVLRHQDRPAAAAAGGDRGERGAVRAGDLGRFRPPRGGRDHHRRDAVSLCRDQAHHKTPEGMDGAAARPHRAA